MNPNQPVCTPCEKGNCVHCLYEVVNVITSMVVICTCDQAAHCRCESCGQFLIPEADADCEHGRMLCVACRNECRMCEDQAGMDERTERAIAERRGN